LKGGSITKVAKSPIKLSDKQWFLLKTSMPKEIQDKFVISTNPNESFWEN
jgi:hypothetical protein